MLKKINVTPTHEQHTYFLFDLFCFCFCFDIRDSFNNNLHKIFFPIHSLFFSQRHKIKDSERKFRECRHLWMALKLIYFTFCKIKTKKKKKRSKNSICLSSSVVAPIQISRCWGLLKALASPVFEKIVQLENCTTKFFGSFAPTFLKIKAFSSSQISVLPRSWLFQKGKWNKHKFKTRHVKYSQN